MSAVVDGARNALADTAEEARDAVDRVESDWAHERPDVDISSMGIITRIWRIGRHLEQLRKEKLLEFDSDRGTIDVLGMLRRAGPPYRRSAGELTKSALITSSGVSQRLDKLERAGLIIRDFDRTDRRRIDVQLTPAGVELVDALLVGLMDHDSRLLAEALDPGEQQALETLLRKFLLFLEPLDEEG